MTDLELVRENRKLREALRLLHDEALQYSTLHELGAENSYAMRAARRTLGLPEFWGQLSQRRVRA